MQKLSESELRLARLLCSPHLSELLHAKGVNLDNSQFVWIKNPDNEWKPWYRQLIDEIPMSEIGQLLPAPTAPELMQLMPAGVMVAKTLIRPRPQDQMKILYACRDESDKNKGMDFAPTAALAVGMWLLGNIEKKTISVNVLKDELA